jgi:enoyl-CoA hydratase
MSTVKIERLGRAAVLRLDKPRGNAIDGALVEDLQNACEELAADDGVQAVLLASAHPKLFSPGLDLPTLIQMPRRELHSFMGRFANAVWALFGLTKPVVAALSGHAVAGGCILALTADWRVLRQGAQIGLNEVKVGVPLPWSVALLLRARVPPSALTRVALLGRNFAGEEAVAVGLADETCEAEQFDARCQERMQEFLDKDARALAVTKGYLRASVLSEMRSREAELTHDFLDCWFSPAGQERLHAAVASLTKK